jgi:hypothetical protein
MPARPYTVTSTLPKAGSSFALLADACRYYAALRHSQPHFTHALLGPNGQPVPVAEILKGLAVVRYDAERTLASLGTYEATTAPAYDTTPDMPAQEIAEQAIKEAREQRPDLPAFTCYTTTIAGPLAGQTQTWVRGEVGTTATVQPKMLAFLRQCKKEGARWDDSRDFSEPTPAGATEVCLWLMWGTAVHRQGRILSPRRGGVGPAAARAPAGSPAPGAAAAGLEPWQRQALIDAAGGEPADLLATCTDYQLVLAAGFMPMLPALLQPEQHHLLPETPARPRRGRRPAGVLPTWNND